MRTVFVLLAAACLAGCARPSPPPLELSGLYATERTDELLLGIEVPRNAYGPDETIPVRITVRNVSSEPVTITADSSSPVHVLVYSFDGVGWDEVLYFPRAELLVTRSWTLRPGATRRFPLNLPITPAWPREEPLRLAGVVNGVEGVEAAVEIVVRSHR